MLHRFHILYIYTDNTPLKLQIMTHDSGAMTKIVARLTAIVLMCLSLQ